MPGRGGPDWAATNTTVSPNCTKTAPLACLAISPVVRLKVRPPISRSTVTFTNIFLNEILRLELVRTALCGNPAARTTDRPASPRLARAAGQNNLPNCRSAEMRVT